MGVAMPHTREPAITCIRASSGFLRRFLRRPLLNEQHPEPGGDKGCRVSYDLLRIAERSASMFFRASSNVRIRRSR